MTVEMTGAPRRLVEKTYTERNRYGSLFPAIRSLDQAFGLKSRRILSYGCSSGEECLTLRELFPDAVVVGTDANPAMVKAARAACRHDKKITIRPYERFWEGSDQFDLVFCMSVLFLLPFQFIPKPQWQAMLANPEQRKTALDTFAEGLRGKFPFSEFENIVIGIDRRVKPGGIMVLQNANYRLTETRIGKNYEPVIFPGTNLETMTKLTSEYVVIDQDQYTEIVFRKSLARAGKWRAMVRRLAG